MAADSSCGSTGNAGSAPITPSDPNVRNTPEAPRLSRQCAEILQLFRELGEVSNHGLACISLKYTSRISDLRRAGYRISVKSRDTTTGVVWYVLDGAA